MDFPIFLYYLTKIELVRKQFILLNVDCTITEKIPGSVHTGGNIFVTGFIFGFYEDSLCQYCQICISEKSGWCGKIQILNLRIFEFSLNVFTEFNDKKYYIYKRLFEPATSCVRDQDATTAPARHR